MEAARVTTSGCWHAVHAQSRRNVPGFTENGEGRVIPADVQEESRHDRAAVRTTPVSLAPGDDTGL
jgi:hypothetical protein